MADLVFYTNPQSRGRIVRWMLEEVGQPYDTEIVRYDRMKNERYLAVNPMGKVPAIKHRGHIVTECAAICAYLADVFPEAGLGPRDRGEGRLLPLVLLRCRPDRSGILQPGDGLGSAAPDRERMFGYGNFDARRRGARRAASLRDYVCGDRFTAADVYVGSQIMFPMQFGMLPERDSFVRYRDACSSATPTSARTRSTRKRRRRCKLRLASRTGITRAYPFGSMAS